MTRWGVSVVFLILSSCLRSNSVICSDGTVCPPSTTCDLEHGQCLTPDQLTSCNGKQDGDLCPIANALGVCRDGLCLAVVCGDGLVQGSEQCDSAPPDFGCLDQGYDAGFLDCIPAVCAPTFSECQRIGWKPLAVPGVGAVTSMSVVGNVGFAGRQTDLLRFRNNAWEPIALPGGGNILLSVFAGAPDRVFVATENGTLRFDGTSWLQETTVDTVRATLAGTSADDVYLFAQTASTTQWTAQHFDGQGWSSLPPLPSTAQLAWAGPSGVWISDGTALFRSTTSGASWQTVVTPLATVQFVVGFGSTIFIGGVDAGTARVARSDDGASWQTFDISSELGTVSTGALALGGRSATDLYAFVRGGSTVVHFDGSTWQRTASPEAVSVIASIGDQVFAGTNTGVSRESPNGFADVSSTVIGAQPLGGTAIWGRDCRDVYLALSSVSTADPSQLFRYDGTAWSPEATLPMTTVNALFGTRDGALYATTYAGDVLQRTMAGWSVMRNLPQSPLRGGWAGDGGFVVAFGDDGWVHRFSGTWTSIQLPDRVDSIWGLAPDDLYAIRQNGVMSGIAHFDGVQWSDVPLPSNPNRRLRAIWGTNDLLIAVGQYGEALLREGGVWRSEPSMPYDNFVALHGTDANDVFAIGEQGTIAHFDGQHWSRVRHDASALRSVWTSDRCTYFGAGYSQLELHRLSRRASW